MINPIVSVTIATYNVEEFVAASMECIISQTLKNIEIICIDDGSSDMTLAILKEYALKDTRVRIIAKDKNEGLAVARNDSLKLAKGKYVAFVDGDDLMDTMLFEKAVILAEKEASDLVMWDYCTFTRESEITKAILIPSALKKIDPKDKNALLKRPAFTWIKLYRTQVLRNLNIKFPIGLTRQDIPIHWHLVTMLDKISILPEKLSYYRQRPQATTHQNGPKLLDLAEVMDVTKQVLINNQCFEAYENEYYRQQLNLLHGMYDSVSRELKKQALELITLRLNAEHWSYINSHQPLRRQARLFYLSQSGDLSAIVQYKIWKIMRHAYRMIKSA